MVGPMSSSSCWGEPAREVMGSMTPASSTTLMVASHSLLEGQWAGPQDPSAPLGTQFQRPCPSEPIFTTVCELQRRLLPLGSCPTSEQLLLQSHQVSPPAQPHSCVVAEDISFTQTGCWGIASIRLFASCQLGLSSSRWLSSLDEDLSSPPSTISSAVIAIVCGCASSLDSILTVSPSIVSPSEVFRSAIMGRLVFEIFEVLLVTTVC